MKKYTVFFEIYGKKLKTVVYAESEAKAREIVKNKVVFHKIEEVADPQVEYLKNLFNIK